MPRSLFPILGILVLWGCGARRTAAAVDPQWVDAVVQGQVDEARDALARRVPPPRRPATEAALWWEGVQTAERRGELARSRALASELVARWPTSEESVWARSRQADWALQGRPVPDPAALPGPWVRAPADGAVGPGPWLLLFWDPTCPACAERMPGALALARRHGLQPVVWARWPPGLGEAVVHRSAAAWGDAAVPIRPGPDDWWLRLEVRGVPEAAVVHRGRVRWRGPVRQLTGALLGAVLDPLEMSGNVEPR